MAFKHGLVKTQHPVTIFCIVNLLLVILISIIISPDYVPFQLAPGIFAILITAALKGKKGIYSLLRKLKYEKVYAKWYLFALLVPFVFCAISYIFFSIANYGQLSFPNFDRAVSFFIVECFIITIGSYGEELGWRGYLLPELRKKHSLLSSSFIIGLIWGIWHLCIGFGVTVFIIYLIMVIEFSLIFSWLNQKTSNNILSAIILHSSFNLSALLFYSDIFTSNAPKNDLMFMMYGEKTRIRKARNNKKEQEDVTRK